MNKEPIVTEVIVRYEIHVNESIPFMVQAPASMAAHMLGTYLASMQPIRQSDRFEIRKLF